MLDVTRLRVLVAVARHGSVTAAARALNYAQPSVSHHIARLEAETGTQLLERVGRGVRLTEAGQLLAERAEEIIGRMDSAEAELAAHVGLRSGRARLAAFPSALGTIVPAAAARLAEETPGLELMLTEAEPPEALRMLRAGYVDVAVVFRHYQEDAGDPPPQPADEGTRGLLLLDEPVHLVTPAHAEGKAGPAAGGTVPIARLAAYAGSRWIAGCERCRAHLVRQCESAGFTPRISFTTDDYLAVQALVAAGLGVTTLPGLCLRAARHPGVVTAPLAGARRHVFAMTYGQTPGSRAMGRLITSLQQVAAEPDAATPGAATPESPGDARLDLRGLRSPVRVAQASLEQLAARVTRQFGDEVDGFRPLHLRQPAGQASQNVRRQRLPRLHPSGRLHDCLDLLTPLLVRDAEHGDVRDLRVHDDLGLDLGRVDVGSARDDHVGLPVAQIQEAVLGQVADVADGEVAIEPVRLGLGLVAVVLELHQAHLHVDRARGTGRLGVAVFVGDQQFARRPGQPDGARMCQPVLRGGDRAATLGRRVVLPDAGTPPVEHLLLDADGAGRGGMDQPAHRRQVVLRLRFVWQGQHALEMRRHHVRAGAPVAFGQRQRGLGVEALHADQRVTQVQRRAAERRHGSVVVRRAHQVRVGLAVDDAEHAK